MAKIKLRTLVLSSLVIWGVILSYIILRPSKDLDDQKNIKEEHVIEGALLTPEGSQAIILEHITKATKVGRFQLFLDYFSTFPASLAFGIGDERWSIQAAYWDIKMISINENCKSETILNTKLLQPIPYFMATLYGLDHNNLAVGYFGDSLAGLSSLGANEGNTQQRYNCQGLGNGYVISLDSKETRPARVGEMAAICESYQEASIRSSFVNIAKEKVILHGIGSARTIYSVIPVTMTSK